MHSREIYLLIFMISHLDYNCMHQGVQHALMSLLSFLLFPGISLVWRIWRTDHSFRGAICDFAHFDRQCCGWSMAGLYPCPQLSHPHCPFIQRWSPCEFSLPGNLSADMYLDFINGSFLFCFHFVQLFTANCWKLFTLMLKCIVLQGLMWCWLNVSPWFAPWRLLFHPFHYIRDFIPWFCLSIHLWSKWNGVISQVVNLWSWLLSIIAMISSILMPEIDLLYLVKAELIRLNSFPKINHLSACWLSATLQYWLQYWLSDAIYSLH